MKQSNNAIEKSIYHQMIDFKNKNGDIKNLYYVGKINLNELNPNGTESINTYDIYLSIDGNKHTFYNNDGEKVAVNNNDALGIVPSENHQDIANKIKQLMSTFKIDNQISLEDLDTELEKIQEATDIPKDKILSLNEVDLKEIIPNNISNNDKTNQIDEDTNDNHEKLSKKDTTLKAREKQETDLSQTVDEYHTLGDILGIPEDGKLVAVESDSIENGGARNGTRFTFLIKDKYGKYSRCDKLEQIGGITPDTTIGAAKSNTYTDNAEVKQEQVNSMYRIIGPTNIQYVLTVKIGQYGDIELALGQQDKTHGVNDSNLSVTTTPLTTHSTFRSSEETRENMNSTTNGVRSATNRTKEGAKHPCEELATTEEYDGDPDTGHKHYGTLSSKQVDEMVEELYTSDCPYSKKELKDSIIYNAIRFYNLPYDLIKDKVEAEIGRQNRFN